ncbi:ECF transporter S component [Isobaculum melis]|uniref:Riboflavin transporter n=1 Tax=Isobaculum melis TaxID=142588 RepID=A0A1H9R9P7_9LACT|nr:ECF transporter S component [Isobaculum melis]SER68759.1 Riboflavin transporter FmnP [Isobaculum melis]
MKKFQTKKIVGIAMLAALGYVLMIVGFPIPFLPTYMKVDFSDIPALLGMFLYGPWAGVGIALIRNLLHFITSGDITGIPIGEFANFISCLAYILPIYWFMKQSTSMKRMIGAGILGTLSLTIVMSVLNWFVLTPLYAHVLGMNFGPIQTVVLLGVLPFNLLKGILVSGVFAIVYVKMASWIEHARLKTS